jgi:hypothetical protein
MLMVKVYDTVLKIKHHRQKTYTTILMVLFCL